jgi:hypothetical protein
VLKYCKKSSVQDCLVIHFLTCTIFQRSHSALSHRCAFLSHSLFSHPGSSSVSLTVLKRLCKSCRGAAQFSPAQLNSQRQQASSHSTQEKELHLTFIRGPECLHRGTCLGRVRELTWIEIGMNNIPVLTEVRTFHFSLIQLCHASFIASTCSHLPLCSGARRAFLPKVPTGERFPS